MFEVTLEINHKFYSEGNLYSLAKRFSSVVCVTRKRFMWNIGLEVLVLRGGMCPTGGNDYLEEICFFLRFDFEIVYCF